MVDGPVDHASAVEQLLNDEGTNQNNTEASSVAPVKKISITIKGGKSTNESKSEGGDSKQESKPKNKDRNIDTDKDSAAANDNEEKGEKKPRKERLRSEYPKVIEPLPPKPDYAPVEKAVKKLDDKIAKSKEIVASITNEISALDEKLKALSFDSLSEDLRKRLKNARDEYAALQNQKNEIYSRLNPITDKIKSLVGSGKSFKNFNSIADQISDLKYEIEHTSMTPEEEKKSQAEIKKLSEKVKCLPKVRELEDARADIEKELDVLKKKMDPVKEKKDMLEKEANDALSKNNPDQLNRSEILAKLKELRANRDKENKVMDTFYSEKKSILGEYRTAMRAYTSEERRVEAQTNHRAFLRNKWKTLCRLINGAGATITEQGDESGEFIVSLYPLTELPKRDLQRTERETRDTEQASDKPSSASLAVIEIAKAKLIKWCEDAIATETFGTTKKVKTGKKTELIFNKDLCDLLNDLDIDHGDVSTKEGVTKVLKMLKGEPDDDNDEAKEQKKLEEEEAKKAAEAAEEEARQKAKEAEEKKQKRLEEINKKIASWIDEMVDFKAIINFA